MVIMGDLQRSFSSLLFKTLLMLWFVSVIVESDIHKRDVHRIVLQSSRRPRSHKSHHTPNHHTHSRGHGSRNHRHKYGHHRDSREKDRYNHSYDNEDSASYSREESRENIRDNSFEKFLHQHHQNKGYSRPRGGHRPKSHSLNDFEYQESRIYQHPQEWSPLVSYERNSSEEIYKQKKKLAKNRKRSKPADTLLEFTTSYPSKIPFSFYEPNYPPIDHSFTSNQKTFDSRNIPVLNEKQFIPILYHNSTVVKPIVNKYEVEENLNLDLYSHDTSFKALTPPTPFVPNPTIKISKPFTQDPKIRDNNRLPKSRLKRPQANKKLNINVTQ